MACTHARAHTLYTHIHNRAHTHTHTHTRTHRGFSIGTRPRSAVPKTIDFPSPCDYAIRRDGITASGDYASRKGATFKYAEALDIPHKREATEASVIPLQTPETLSSLGHAIRKTHYSSAPIFSMGGKVGSEYEQLRQAGMMWDESEGAYVSVTPGPQKYKIKRPSTAHVPVIQTREGWEAQSKVAAGWKLRMFAREQRDDNGGNTSVDKSAPRSPKHGHADAGRDRSGSGAHAPHGRGSHSYQNSRDTQTQHESKGVDTSLDSSANRHMAHSSSRSEEATTTLVYETAWEDVNVWPAPSDYAPRMRHDGRKIGPEAAPAFSMGVKVKDKEVEGTPGPGRCVGSRVCVCA